MPLQAPDWDLLLGLSFPLCALGLWPCSATSVLWMVPLGAQREGAGGLRGQGPRAFTPLPAPPSSGGRTPSIQVTPVSPAFSAQTQAQPTPGPGSAPSHTRSTCGLGGGGVAGLLRVPAWPVGGAGEQLAGARRSVPWGFRDRPARPLSPPQLPLKKELLRLSFPGSPGPPPHKCSRHTRPVHAHTRSHAPAHTCAHGHACWCLEAVRGAQGKGEARSP